MYFHKYIELEDAHKPNFYKIREKIHLQEIISYSN